MLSACRLPPCGVLNRQMRVVGISKYDLALYSYDGNHYAGKSNKDLEIMNPLPRTVAEASSERVTIH